MFKDFEVHFTPQCSEYVLEEYANATALLEYGSGGSTLAAAELGKTVVTTESSAVWLVELMGAYTEKKLPGEIIPIHVDIGETAGYGEPVNEDKWKGWPRYATKPWRYVKEHQLDVDLVLVDGRFRVASFIASCVKTTRPVKILFDDYADRPHYHVVEKIAQPEKIVGDRMAVFEIEPNMVSAGFLLQHLSYFYNHA